MQTAEKVYKCAAKLGRAKCVHKSSRKHRNSLIFARIQICQKRSNSERAREFQSFFHGQSIYKWPLDDTGPWFTVEIYKMYSWIKFVCLCQEQRFTFLFVFLFCTEGWCLPLTRWLLILPWHPYILTPIGCTGPWFFAQCANLAFLQEYDPP